MLTARSREFLRAQRRLRLIGNPAKSCDPQKLRTLYNKEPLPFGQSGRVEEWRWTSAFGLRSLALIRPFTNPQSVNFTRKIYTQDDVRYPLWSRGLDVSGTAGGRTVRRLCGFPAVSGQSPPFDNHPTRRIKQLTTYT